MNTVLLILVVLHIKHWYADFVIQTYKQTVHKGIYRDPVGISHSLDHTCCSLVALGILSLFLPIHAGLVLLLCVLEGIIHYHIDWIKVRYGCKDNTKPQFWNQFGQDQLAHQLTYVAMAWLLVAA